MSRKIGSIENVTAIRDFSFLFKAREERTREKRGLSLSRPLCGILPQKIGENSFLGTLRPEEFSLPVLGFLADCASYYVVHQLFAQEGS